MADTNKQRVRVTDEAAIPEDTGLLVQAGGTPIALFKVEGKCYAIDNACPHRGGPLAEGDLEGHIVHCPWHGWTWDVRTGENRRQAGMKVACYPVTVEDGGVFIEVGASSI